MVLSTLQVCSDSAFRWSESRKLHASLTEASKWCSFVVVVRRHHLHPSEVVQHPNLAHCHLSKEPVVVNRPVDHLRMPAEQHLLRKFSFCTIHLKCRIHSQISLLCHDFSIFNEHCSYSVNCTRNHGVQWRCSDADAI